MENYMIYKNQAELQFIVTGDSEGQIHIYVLNEVLSSKHVSAGETPKDQASQSRSFKRENLNVTLEVQSKLQNEVNYYIPHTLEANNCIRLKRWKAHDGPILSISTIPHVK